MGWEPTWGVVHAGVFKPASLENSSECRWTSPKERHLLEILHLTFWIIFKEFACQIQYETFLIYSQDFGKTKEEKSNFFSIFKVFDFKLL